MKYTRCLTQERKLGLALAIGALLALPAIAQEPAREPGASTDPETEVIDQVIVRGRRLSEVEADLRIEIGKFLAEVAAPARGRGYARWYRRVCVGVHNLEQSAAQYVVDRVSKAALEVGLEPGEPGCRPEVNIIFATNAKEVASLMVETNRRAFQPMAGHAGADLGRQALDEFVRSDKAVRWWHVSKPVGAHHRELAVDLPAARMCTGAICAQAVNVQGPSRIHSGIVDELQYTIVVVDATKLAGTTWQQLGDYLALVSLAQVDLQSDPAAFDSILNLFTNPAAYSGLTDWDRSYLEALYDFDQERSEQAQRNELVSRIAESELERR